MYFTAINANISNTYFVLLETIHSPMVASSSTSSGNYLESLDREIKVGYKECKSALPIMDEEAFTEGEPEESIGYIRVPLMMRTNTLPL